MTRWYRDRWAEAIWAADLPTQPKIVALAYADHARDKREAWVSLPRLMERTGLSRTSCKRAMKQLRADGWLTMTTKESQHRARRFLLTLPASGSPQDPWTNPRGSTQAPRGLAQDPLRRPSGSTVSPDHKPNPYPMRPWAPGVE